MHAIFQQNGKKMLKEGKKGKIIKNLGKKLQNLKIFLKREGGWV